MSYAYSRICLNRVSYIAMTCVMLLLPISNSMASLNLSDFEKSQTVFVGEMDEVMHQVEPSDQASGDFGADTNDTMETLTKECADLDKAIEKFTQEDAREYLQIPGWYKNPTSTQACARYAQFALLYRGLARRAVNLCKPDLNVAWDNLYEKILDKKLVPDTPQAIACLSFIKNQILPKLNLVNNGQRRIADKYALDLAPIFCEGEEYLNKLECALDDALSTSEDRRSTSEDRSSASEDRSSTSEDRSSASEDRRSTSEDRRSTSEDRRSTSEDRSSTSEDRRSTSEDRRSTSEDRRSTSEDRLSSPEDRRSTSEDRLSSPEDRRSTSEDRPEHS